MGQSLPTQRELGIRLREFADAYRTRLDTKECVEQFERLVPKGTVVSYQEERHEIVQLKWCRPVEDITAFAVVLKNLRTGELTKPVELVEVLRPAPKLPAFIHLI